MLQECFERSLRFFIVSGSPLESNVMKKLIRNRLSIPLITVELHGCKPLNVLLVDLISFCTLL